MNRYFLREHCFKLIFNLDFFSSEEDKIRQVDLYFEQFDEIDVEDYRDSHIIEKTSEEVHFSQKVSETNIKEIKDRIKQFISSSKEVDEEIEKTLSGWNITRIGKIELAILRLAVFEIKYINEIDKAVSINEALNLAKKFNDFESAKFINGVLKSI